MRRFWIKIRSWEYWPVWIVYFIVFFAWLLYSIRLRSFMFFTTVNPSIEMGGMMGESKIGILNQIPAEYKPKEVLVKPETDFQEITNILKDSGIGFPCIAKPDVGERGFRVEVCHTYEELSKYHNTSEYLYIIQEYIDYEEEYSVLYYRYPDEKNGHISSLCKKEFLQVEGNGIDTLSKLLLDYDRAYLQYDRLKKKTSLDFLEVIPKGTTKVIETIGNHSKGTKFLDYNKNINERLIKTFDKIFAEMPDIHFGRADLKCTSLEDLINGKNLRIVEINGVSAEPAHIYDPNYSFYRATRDLLSQWNVLYKISKTQINKGIKPMSVVGVYCYINNYRKKLTLPFKN